MIPIWLITDNEEFSFLYNEEQRVSIKGRKHFGKWVVDVRVEALPYFVFGCNNFNTESDNAKDVIRYFLMDVINSLVGYPMKGKDKLLEKLKEYI